MTSAVGIGNIALDHLGETTISSFSDEVKAARILNRRYEQVRDAVLQAHLWNSAIARAELASVDPAPIWGPGSAFQLPGDCLRVIGIKPRDHQWKREGRLLVSDASAPVFIRYLKRVVDPNAFDPLLIEAIAARLASDMAIPIKDSRTMQSAFWDLYLQKVKEACGVDAQEGTAEVVNNDGWLTARATGVGDPFGSDEDWA